MNIRFLETFIWIARLGSFRADTARLAMNLQWQLGHRQELRVKLETIALDARLRQAWQVGPGGRPVPTGEAIPDFSLANLGFQVRYRYELAPLSYLYIAYVRGGSMFDEHAGMRYSAIDELGDACPGVRRTQPEVVAQVPLGRDTHRHARYAQQDAVRILDRGRWRVHDGLRQHPLGQVIDPLKPAPGQGGDLPGPEQPFQRPLPVRPGPPAGRAARPDIANHNNVALHDFARGNRFGARLLGWAHARATPGGTAP